MPQHTTQLNDFTASASMDAFLSRPFRWKAPVPFDVHPRSENQLIEGRLAGLMQNPTSIIARDVFIGGLDDQYDHGHQSKEFATSSHAPHWYRSMAVALWWALEHGDHVDGLLSAVLRWWSCDAWVREQYLVPHGPLAGKVIGWGARNGAFNGQNDLRDIVDALLARRPLDGKQKHTLSNASKNADTFGAHVIQSLIAKHSSTLNTIKPIEPKIAYDLTIVRTSDALTCTCKNPDKKDPHILNVDYQSGKVSIS